jgi:hypothetical protein
MSTQSDSGRPVWGGLRLGIELGIIPSGTTQKDVKHDDQRHNQLKKTYLVLAELGVGKVRGQFVDTPDGLRAKVAKAAADNAAAVAAKKAAARINIQK